MTLMINSRTAMSIAMSTRGADGYAQARAGIGHEFVIRFLTGTVPSLGLLVRFAPKSTQ